MSDFDLISGLVASLTTYGPAALSLVLLLAALGTPLPSSLLVVATGALVRQGLIDGATAVALGLLGAVLGDIASYAIGRSAGRRVQGLQTQSGTWGKAQMVFAQAGGPAVYLTRWALTPLAVPVNLIAGGSGFAFWRFLAYDVAGELTWLVLYGGLGYVLGSQWEWVGEQADVLSAALLGAAVLAGALYALVRYMRQSATPLTLNLPT